MSLSTSESLPTYDDILAPYACRAANSRGRLHNEPSTSQRSPFQRDRDRIIHSSGFRRMKYKTQVFVYHEGDHYRTRLTHSLEVAQIARSMCRALHLNEDLGETLALAHDLGHPPFGHAGEDVLNEAMKGYGGFDHNAQAVRLVTLLETRYASFSGLNLTWETLEGIVKHGGPLVDQPIDVNNIPNSVPTVLHDYLKKHDLEVHNHASVEAQLAGISDDIAYASHDMDDGLRAGFFSLSDLKGIPFVSQLIDEVTWTYPDAGSDAQINELVRRLINRLVNDVLHEARSRIEKVDPSSPDDIRRAGKPVVAFSPDTGAAVTALKKFLHDTMYKHYLVNRMTSKSKRVVNDLFQLYIREPECLPTEWFQASDGPETPETARVVADFIAGMTDRYAFREHAKLFDLSAVSL